MADGSAGAAADDGSDVTGGGASADVLVVLVAAASVAGVFDDDAISFWSFACSSSLLIVSLHFECLNSTDKRLVCCRIYAGITVNQSRA